MKKNLKMIFAAAWMLSATTVMAQTGPAVEQTGFEPTPEFMQKMRHASPMPNLMKVVVEHGDELGLDDTQKRLLRFWREHKMIQAKRLVERIDALESELHDAALAGKPTGYLIATTSKMLSLRMQLASQKILCRDNMMHVLKPEQWNKLVALYEKAQAKAAQAATPEDSAAP